MFSSSHHDDIDDSTLKALTIRYPLVTSNRIMRYLCVTLPEYHLRHSIYLTFKHRYAISAFTSNAFTVADVREFLKLQLVSPEHYGPTALKIRKKRKKKKKKKTKKKKKS